MPHPGSLDFDRNPLMLYWELTQACELACRHCRADAQPDPHPDELTPAAARDLVQRLARFGDPLPHVVFTGGDPLKRSDLFELIALVRSRGFLTAIAPSGTYALIPEVIRRFKETGIWMLGLSLDGSNPALHDGIRGVDGTFDKTVKAMKEAGTIDLPIQVNTLVCEETVGDLPALHDLLAKLGVARWSLFFLVQMGRGKELKPLGADRAEETLRWLAGAAEHSPLDIKTTEAPMYRRIQLEGKEGIPPGMGVRDGCGVMFISHLGEIFPSGFLPILAGNVKKDDPVDIYRNSELFRSLRRPDEFKGRCGICEYRGVCGGARARAFAVTGDPLETDPLCGYEPRARR